ncbi:hypothetical protein Bca4012_011507 [Brassica carinata]
MNEIQLSKSWQWGPIVEAAHQKSYLSIVVSLQSIEKTTKTAEIILESRESKMVIVD